MIELIGKKFILILDDEVSIHRIIEKILQNDNIQIISAYNVQQAGDLLDKRSFDLLLVDYSLVNGIGTEIVEKSRIDHPTTPVIMISGGGIDVRTSSLEHGANVFIEKPFNGKDLRSIILNLIALAEAHKNLDDASDIIVALCRAVESRDSYTQGHSQRVAKFALSLYDLVGFDNAEERSVLSTGCLLHDIGKIGILDNILKSDKKLSKEEFNEIKTHPERGYNICKDLNRLKKSLDIILHHHEKSDGSGYPAGLKENEIPEIIQIVTIADIYDALTSERAYREKNSPVEAIKIMREDAEKCLLSKYYLELFSTLFK